MNTLRLKKTEERRLKGGHLWVYSNEVDVAVTPLTGFSAGELVVIEEANGKALGVGYVNPASLICARLLSRDPKQVINEKFFAQRIEQALNLREKLFRDQCYRLIYGDADGLPGLIVDRFGAHLVVQLGTYGIDNLQELIISALIKVLAPESILLRNDGSIRQLESLPEAVVEVYGSVPDEVLVIENGVKFIAPIKTGQKTGWFFDHRMNRARLQNYVPGLRVLDVFSYIGGWGVQAAVFGAREVTCLDASAQALDYLQRNAELNGVGESVVCLEGDAFAALAELKNQGERFDLIITDPPAFIKRKKDFRNGLEGYRRINELAIRLLNRDGYLVSASCSMHLDEASHRDLLRASSRHLDRHLAILEQGHQGPDHPIHPAIPETQYLKALFARVTPA